MLLFGTSKISGTPNFVQLHGLEFSIQLGGIKIDLFSQRICSVYGEFSVMDTLMRLDDDYENTI